MAEWGKHATRLAILRAARGGTNDDLGLTGKIAWAHRKEFPDYYTRPDQLEVEADPYWTSRR